MIFGGYSQIGLIGRVIGVLEKHAIATAKDIDRYKALHGEK